MRLRPSITSHCILSVYLLSAALLSTVVVANPIPDLRRGINFGDMILKLAWRSPGEEHFKLVADGFEAVDQFSLFFTGHLVTELPLFSTGHLSTIGYEAQVVSPDSSRWQNSRLEKVDIPRRSKSQVIDYSRVRNLAADNQPLTAHFINEDFSNQHYAVIKNVNRLYKETNVLLKKKAKEFEGISMQGDLKLQRAVGFIRDDLDWINTVLLYLTLINQPESGVPVLDPKELVEWTKIFEEMTSKRQTVKSQKSARQK
ncbi:hypothetical protein GGU10DRAFT_90245 [Lentinula aff. detonsa]|uniref:Uncharacterized protein n=1 Tax=Lentinula aff. detonsa TaxID=2804958 RepID=A0AA38KPN1_9AGAR|nr:hypothetical protein GGU10DRAFT_90245 [Lentinula aff. detonsa]